MWPFKKKQQKENHAQILEQRQPIKEILDKTKHKKEEKSSDYMKTGVEGLDELFMQGIPKSSAVLVAGGAGSGKTIMCLQICNNLAKKGLKAMYISLEESEEKLKSHMEKFGWNTKDLEYKNNLIIKRLDPFSIARNVEALLAKAKGELKMDIQEIGELIPKGFKPDIVVVDSLTALAAAFREGEDSYRIYIEQLFRYFEKLKVTSFLISETEQIPVKFSKTGVEEFLADGVIVLYAIQRDNIRENAVEILKMRGVKHQKRIVAMKITDKGIEIYPEQEVFGGLEEKRR